MKNPTDFPTLLLPCLMPYLCHHRHCGFPLAIPLTWGLLSLTWILFSALAPSYMSPGKCLSAVLNLQRRWQPSGSLTEISFPAGVRSCHFLPFSVSLSGFFRFPYLTMPCCFDHWGNSLHNTQAGGFPSASIIWQEFLYVQKQSCTLTTHVHWWDWVLSAALCSSIGANNCQLAYSNWVSWEKNQDNLL